MKPGRRHNAISNSPIVRALIKPVIYAIPPRVEELLPPPTAADLIPTQVPGAASTSALNADSANAKKRKRDVEDDAETKVEVNYNESNLPNELKKYWAQRYRLFSLFDEGCQMDKEGWYSVTPESIAAQIAERCRSSVIVDAFCGVGGNAIQFAFTCEKVIAIDNSPTRLACALKNAEIYGVDDRIDFILADYPTWAAEYQDKKARDQIKEEDQVEVIFLSPPWGGIEYQELPSKPSVETTALETPTPNATHSTSYPLSALQPLHGNEIFSISRKLTPHIAYYLPRNTDIHEIARLPLLYPRSGQEPNHVEKIEVEEEWMGPKMKAITVYFGDLALQD